MSESELSILRGADDPVACEFPLGFDRRRAVDEVRRLKPDVEQIAGHGFDFDDQVQDASFFAELAIHKPGHRVIETVFGVSFSCFGRLFTDRANCASERLPQERVDAIIRRIQAAGLIHVSQDVLSLSYTGTNPAFAGQSWSHRFFDYL